MTKRAKQEGVVDISKQIRDGLGLKNDFAYSLLTRKKTGLLVDYFDTPKMFVLNMNSVLLKIKPQLTEETRPLYDEMKRLVEEIEKERPRNRAWHAPMSLRPSKAAARAETARYTAKRKQVMALLDEADSLHRTAPALAAQEAQAAFGKAQSTRASKNRKPDLDEDKRRRIAKRYWYAKENDESYGIVKALAAEYGVSPTTIQTIVKKYKPN